MLRWFRVRAWCLATAMVVAMGTMGASFDLLLHDEPGDHDAACEPVFERAHDASRHRFEAAERAAGDHAPAHCLVCHWTRSLRMGTRLAPGIDRLPDAGEHRIVSDIGTPVARAAASLSTRAPPSAA